MSSMVELPRRSSFCRGGTAAGFSAWRRRSIALVLEPEAPRKALRQAATSLGLTCAKTLPCRNSGPSLLFGSSRSAFAKPGLTPTARGRLARVAEPSPVVPKRASASIVSWLSGRGGPSYRCTGAAWPCADRHPAAPLLCRCSNALFDDARARIPCDRTLTLELALCSWCEARESQARAPSPATVSSYGTPVGNPVASLLMKMRPSAPASGIWIARLPPSGVKSATVAASSS
mmetsp:Transcript_19184/g.45611  ORF Transcript_19184/g.45611 Transcript_19184/m.45611 type:complete len:232 (-) Transcript_19184:287-982(-)